MSTTLQPKPFTIPVGINKVPDKVKLFPNFRTIEQFEQVRKIVNKPHFKFSCGRGIFDPESSGSTYQGPFCFLWYDTDEKLHSTKIGKRGKILRETSASKSLV